MYEMASKIFFGTLALYVFTLLTVSYVGVYLTYIAIPIIMISWLIMDIAKPSSKKTSTKKKSSIFSIMSDVVKELYSAMIDFLFSIEQQAREVKK